MKKGIVLFGVVSLLFVGCGSMTTENPGSLAESISESADKTAQERAETDASESQVITEKEIINPVVEDIAGLYVCSVDDSTLSVAADGDFYEVELNLLGLTCIDDFTGMYENNILTVAGTDAAGNSITAEIIFSDGQAVLTFTDSTWEYLENGMEFVFRKE